MRDPDVETLVDRFVRLERLRADHRSAVEAAFATDPPAWAVMARNGGIGGFADWWASQCESVTQGESRVFAVRRLEDGQIVGATGFFSIRLAHGGVEIGSTFYQPDARSGSVNPECKLLLLQAAFDAGAVRVEFVTDAINTRSRAALRKLGAVEEGVLRRHKITWTGRVRDSVMFSITDEDWPSVKANLERRLDAATTGLTIPTR